MNLREQQLHRECSLKAIRSGGAGGQHVNKVSSKIELTFPILDSAILDEAQKNILLEKLSTKLNEDGVLRITEDGDRSQHVNRENIIEKFYTLIERALKPVVKRKKTKIPKVVKKKRLESKKKKSEIKKLRRERFS